MKIALDLRCLETSTSKRGIGYFNKHLFEALLKRPHPDIQFELITFPQSRLSATFKTGPNDHFQKIPALFWPKKGLRRLDPFFSLFYSGALKKIKPDLIHILSLFEVYYLSIPANIKSVVTLYDIIPILFPKQYFQNDKAQGWYEERLNQVKRAAKIITISKSSKKDIQRALKIPSEGITVIYGGVDERFKPTGREQTTKILAGKYKITNPYILTVSTPSYHKNTSRMFQAFKTYIESRDANLSLVVVCKLIPQEKRDWNEELKKLNIENRVILTNFVPDEDLPYLYSGAEVLLFPSLYEGLGLPVLESFACGTAVITSNVSSLPEIAGDAAFYTNPQSVQDIKMSLDKVLNDEALRERLIKKGFAQVKKFSWKQAADQTLKVYQEVLVSS